MKEQKTNWNEVAEEKLNQWLHDVGLDDKSEDKSNDCKQCTVQQ